MACDCLTCGILAVINRRAEAVHAAAPKPSGPSIDAAEVVTAFADILGSMAEQCPEESAGDALIAFAHEALDAALEVHRSGVPQTVKFNLGPRAVH